MKRKLSWYRVLIIYSLFPIERIVMRTPAGKWFFSFDLKIEGENSIGESVDLSRHVEIRLYVTSQEDAERQVRMMWRENKYNILPDEIRCSIAGDDNLYFYNPRLIYLLDM